MTESAGGGWHEREAAIMGTRIAVQLWAEDPELARLGIDSVIAEMHRVDRLMSTYKPESQLSQVNAHAHERPITVDPDIVDVVAKSFEYSRLSDGLFDVTYASVGHLYDYRAGRHPSDGEIAAALPAVDYRQVEVDRERCTIRFLKPGMRIDLGGFAKGWAVDRGAAILRSLGIRNAMVTAGGDTRFVGDRLGKPWIVGIRDPRREGAVVTRLPLVDEAVSTSGDYERYFEQDGVRYHHILVPGTGRSPAAVRSVTIIGPTATHTDGLTKPVFILGVERGMEYLRRVGDVDAVIIDAEGAVYYSPGLEPRG
ncbi:MAG TPA: FAD:protein FMN transferase [Steroidobacteraceae bacterium]|nr:FAD:protein FMN transferase [Steroidobacteraceae bacterium]HQR48117.1 FAD:protein FMN transferase [Steroidobacteraceae bacterium]